MERLLRNRLLVVGLVGLLLGQLLFFVQFTTLYTIALVFTLAICVPYPRVVSSWISRLLFGFLLAFSIIQLMGALQFFIFPKSGFSVLSLLVTLATVALALALLKREQSPPSGIASKKDLAALLTGLFFIIPFCALCFWKNNPAYILSFASNQSPDGASHLTAINEMSSTQHLDYRTVQYYPKGFHLASAFFMNSLHASVSELSWVANSRVYILTYLFWGLILTYFVIYLAIRLFEVFLPNKRLPTLLLACGIGPVLALLYLLPFAQEGFLNYYYVVAAVLCGALFLFDYQYGRKNDDWWLGAYLLLTFGILMSWGPLLAPALLLAPLMYIWYYKPDLWVMARRYARTYWWVIAGFAAQLVPVYLQFKYARLSSQQGINATGSITNFDYGIVIGGLALTVYYILGRKVPSAIKAFAANFLIPFFVLIGIMTSIQYLSTGELRYYAIKTAYLLEMMILAASAVTLLIGLLQAKLPTLHRWILFPTVLGVAFIMLIGITANPFELTAKMFQSLKHPVHRMISPDIQTFTTLGLRGQLDSTNNVDLHYDPRTGYLYGDELITNWANIMQYTTDSTPAAGRCSGKIFAAATYAVPSPTQQATITTEVKECASQAFLRHRPYFMITDKYSVAHMRAIFGDRITYLY